MGVMENAFPENVVVTTVDSIINWARKSAIWPMYEYLIDHGYPIAVQTRSIDGGWDGNHPVGDLNAILTWAGENGVMSLELPRGWQAHVDASVLAAANAAMNANALGASAEPPAE